MNRVPLARIVTPMGHVLAVASQWSTPVVAGMVQHRIEKIDRFDPYGGAGY